VSSLCKGWITAPYEAARFKVAQPSESSDDHRPFSLMNTLEAFDSFKVRKQLWRLRQDTVFQNPKQVSTAS
jgi:hypothetical protein